MKIRTLAILPAALALAACGGGSGEGSDADVIKVAVLDAQTGAFSAIGLPSMRGATMAFDEINEAGGIEVDGTTYTFDYTSPDLQSDATVAASEAQKAISGDQVKVIIGATTSAIADPVAGAIQRAGDQVIMLAPATVMDQYVGPDSMLFRTLLNDEDAAARYIPALRELFPEVESISTLMINDAIGESIMDIYPPIFEAEGFAVDSQDSFPVGETNFAPLLQRTPADVDGFFVGYTDPVTSAVVNAAAEAGRAAVFFTRGTTCQVGLDLADKIDALTCQLLTEDPTAPSTPEAEEFFAAYEEHFDTTVDSNSGSALNTYDWVYLLAQAFEEAGTVDDMGAVAEALRGATYDGVLNVGINDDGTAAADLRIGIVRDGKTEVVSADTE